MSAPNGDVLAKEERFHDEWAASIRIEDCLVDPSFEAVTAFENRWIVEQIGNPAGLRILDLGCGAGEGAAYFAKRGAEVTATDLSPGMLDVARRLAAHHGCTIRTVQCPAEALDLPDAAFDVVYGSNVLHHVDVAEALDEVHRVLKPGGRAYFIEPLTYNPAINVYRRMAGTMRTPDEHPLRLRDLALFRARFHQVRHREMWLFPLYIFVWFYLVERVHPARERYWKKVVKDAHRHRFGMAVAGALDRVCLTLLPFLRFWCWNTVVAVRK